MTKADFVTGLVLFVLGLYMIHEGLQMPGAGGFIEAGGEPGRVPVLLGSVIALLAAILLGRSAVRGGHRLWEPAHPERDLRVGALRCAITAVGCAVYAVGLLGATLAGWEVQYHQATALFLFVFVTAFEWGMAPENGARRWAWISVKAPRLAARLRRAVGFLAPRCYPYLWLMCTALALAVLVTWAVTYLFEQQFYVTLP